MTSTLTADYPQRIVCLTAETVEILWRIGAWDRVVGVSGYAIRPPAARQKPKIGAFTTIYVDRVLALEPDLVVSFSDLQADHVRTLVAAGCNVLAMNQRSLSETLRAILVLGAVVGCTPQAEQLVREMTEEFDKVAALAARLPYRPRVFFEEWPDPLIAGIRWVSELIELAGGDDIFADLRERHDAGSRRVTSEAVLARAPDVIVASWCGKKVEIDRIYGREGWGEVPAIRNGHVYEVKSTYVLQPGPVLVEGVRQIHRLLAKAAITRP